MLCTDRYKNVGSFFPYINLTNYETLGNHLTGPNEKKFNSNVYYFFFIPTWCISSMKLEIKYWKLRNFVIHEA